MQTTMMLITAGTVGAFTGAVVTLFMVNIAFSPIAKRMADAESEIWNLGGYRDGE